MSGPVTQTDEHFLSLCIQAAETTYRDHGNYPVGAALVIDGELVEVSANRINQQKSYLYHAENRLIITHATRLYETDVENQSIVLYSTLEPCLMCLGAAAMNHVNRIVYIQKDPHGGACEMQHDNIGVFYRNSFPEIVHAPISDKPRTLMLDFFRLQIELGQNVEWAMRMLALFGESQY